MVGCLLLEIKIFRFVKMKAGFSGTFLQRKRADEEKKIDFETNKLVNLSPLNGNPKRNRI